MNENVKLYKNAQLYSTVCGPYQCATLSWWVQTPEPVYYPRHKCELEPLVCGEKVFEQIAKDIAGAKRSVDIITWGFDPGMVLIRGSSAEDGQRYGELLRQISCREEDPVVVRVLVWHDDLATEHLMKNNPGYYGTLFPAIGCKTSGYFSAAHQRFNAEWYEEVCAAKLKNICLRVRSVDATAAGKALLREGLPDEASAIGTALFATHHQKMVLIDYEDPAKAIGYVMGHNSITNYWDTSAHLFKDPRRETIYSEDPKEAWRAGLCVGSSLESIYPSGAELERSRKAQEEYLKLHGKTAQPYQDISVRVRGPLLYDLNHNFCQAWGESVPPSSAFMDAYWLATRFLSRGLYAVSREIQRHLAKQPDKGFAERRRSTSPEAYVSRQGRHSAQLMRTHAMHGERTIKECYANLTRNIQHYIFIQNQYVQYGEWATHLLACVQHLRQSGYEKPIYVFILTSTPERSGMDLATYDVAKQLGKSSTMVVEHDEAEQLAKRKQAPMPVSPEKLEEAGINVVMGSLWTSAGNPRTEQDYEEIYIHAKVAIVDDAAFTIGSANLNVRSMVLDSELNVLSQAKDVAFALRSELFKQCSGEPGPAAFCSMKPSFDGWRDLMTDNLKALQNRGPLVGQLLAFHVNRKPGPPII